MRYHCIYIYFKYSKLDLSHRKGNVWPGDICIWVGFHKTSQIHKSPDPTLTFAMLKIALELKIFFLKMPHLSVHTATCSPAYLSRPPCRPVLTCCVSCQSAAGSTPLCAVTTVPRTYSACLGSDVSSQRDDGN